MRRTVAPAALWALCAAALAAPAAAAPDPAGSQRVSNENTLTRWAHPDRLGRVRARPRARSRAVARLRATTEDGYPEVYPVLRRWTGPDGLVWLKVRVPSRRHGTTGWVHRSSLGPLYTVRTRLIIDRRRRRATLLRRGRRVWRAPVGIGAPGTPTPAGRFWIRERFRARGGAYGPWAFGTSAYSRLSDWPGGGVIGIHGTNQPRLIPGRPSHGCIRVRNAAVRRLARLMRVGTPVRIL